MGHRRAIVSVCAVCALSVLLSACSRGQRQESSQEETAAATEMAVETTTTTAFEDAPEPYTFHQFKENILGAKEKNPDAVGWIYVRNTLIDYPVYQYANNNDYYLSRNGKKASDINGSIFADFRCKFDDLSQNTVIYGHNMLSEKMFGSLKRYNDLTFLDNNPIIEFSTAEADRKWKIFAVFFIDPYFNYIEPNPSKELFNEIIDKAREESLFKINNVEVNDDDKILTLSTCAPRSMGDIRFVVMARLLRDGENYRLHFDEKSSPYTSTVSTEGNPG